MMNGGSPKPFVQMELFFLSAASARHIVTSVRIVGYMETCPPTSKWANEEWQPILWNVTEPPKERNPDTSYNMDEP